MTTFTQTNFTSGQITPHLYGRGDLSSYSNGAAKLENVIIHPTGGISRRYGTRYVDKLSGPTRLVPFEFNTEQTYLICFLDKQIKVYEEGVCVCTISSPWSSAQTFELNYTQSADTLLVVHPDVSPRKITRLSRTNWAISTWSYYVGEDEATDKGMIYCPYFNFNNNTVNMSFIGFNGTTVELNTTANIFSSSYVNALIKAHDGLFRITQVIDAKRATAKVLRVPTKWDVTVDWSEEAFSNIRGWPVSVTFHQDRLVIGGSKSLPNRLWMSKSSDIFNFDLGKGLDDDAIDFGILSDQVNAIKSLMSARHLLVFTTGAEWMVTGDPLAPASIQLKRQTSVGSYGKYSLQPQNADGATLFLSRNGSQLREFLYTDTEQAYMAHDLTLLSGDIITSPRDLAFNPHSNILYVVSEDGSASCLTSYRTEEVTAWSKMTTNGSFVSIAISGEDIYFCIKRGGQHFLEIGDKSMFVDCGVKQKSDTPKKTWSGLNYLEGIKVSIMADGFGVDNQVVSGGSITLLNEASEVCIGYPYQHCIEPLPYLIEDNIKPYPPKAYRIISGNFRILDTASFYVDTGNGYFDVPLRRMSKNNILNTDKIRYSGDISLRSIGWIRDMDKPAWSIKSSEPSPFTLLSVSAQIKLKQ